jgi:hypothetical protein
VHGTNRFDFLIRRRTSVGNGCSQSCLHINDAQRSGSLSLGWRTPGIRNGDVVLMKNFHFTESKYLQLGMESFNVTKRRRSGGPDFRYPWI